ncbi:hypothetical protein HDU96_005871 [Phlyctochytrium bullatum]|nr:hypothetical protein HDU96_005871 [Phlyctochytrium bullatum]
MRRDRKDDNKKEAKSQLKVNEAAKNIICTVCRQTFLLTIREKALQEHIESKVCSAVMASAF